ncbi:MAG: 30S ribosomal protein S5 [Nanoarchaeota archaeon]|nr:30S ribosomal protein S5 [Nanoarchaeota archaeon]MCG2718478.1 30S ribosomal protein S5 [Nanoarchaeota archaeon]
MARDVVKNAKKESVDVKQKDRRDNKPTFNLDSWKPKTDIGRKVKLGEIKNIDEILDKGLKMLEPEIVEFFLPNMESILIMVGQSKGKFGGGKRSIWRQTQKKTCEGNRTKFTSAAIVGDHNGYIGLGVGSAKETVPAREKAIRQAKLNLIKIKRGCGSWECSCAGPHSIPFKVKGGCGSVRIEIMPAPKGSNLTIEKECKRMLELAGIHDVYSKTKGQTGTKLNMIKACFAALKQLSQMRVLPEHIEKLGIVEGRNE